jgi:hypothetical protein
MCFGVRIEICQDCAKIGETLFPYVLWIPVKYKDFLMLLETCVAVIGLPILQGFHVKQ